jgi:hypothetical protein
MAEAMPKLAYLLTARGHTGWTLGLLIPKADSIGAPSFSNSLALLLFQVYTGSLLALLHDPTTSGRWLYHQRDRIDEEVADLFGGELGISALDEG